MARSCYPRIAFIVLFLFTLPNRLLAAELELRQAGTGATSVDVLVGDEIEVELWVDSDNEELGLSI